MRQLFEQELKELHVQFFQMGKLVHEAIEKSVRSFVGHDKQLAQEVIDQDTAINQIEIDLEKKCIELIALQQPVTRDLRKIITVMKATADLERMADHAVSISKSTIHVKGTKRNDTIEKQLSETGVELILQSKVPRMVLIYIIMLTGIAEPPIMQLCK